MKSSHPKHTRKRKLRAPLIVSALLAAVIVSGCAKSYVVTAEELCRSWRHQSISKADKLTDATASQIEGNNNARPAWGCVPGQDKAKS